MRIRMTIIAIVAAGIALASCASSEELIKVRTMTIGHPSLDGIADGSYAGSYAYGSFEYAVRVDIARGRIVSIAVTANRDTAPAKKAEGVLARIIELQTPDVEAVSGATTTSKAFMKAVENALEAARAGN